MYAAQDTLKKEIEALKLYLGTELPAEVGKALKIEKYNVTLKPFGMKVEASLTIATGGSSLVPRVYIAATNLESKRFGPQRPNCNDYNTFAWSTSVDLPEVFVEPYQTATRRVKELTQVLTDVMQNIKDMSRKEREIRGALAERTLKDMGVTDLFDNADLLKLISMDTIPALSTVLKKDEVIEATE